MTTREKFQELEALGLTMYGQMTAGSWIYIGSQGILRVLTTDPGTGIMRHVDAGYDIAVDAAKKFGIKIPMMK